MKLELLLDPAAEVEVEESPAKKHKKAEQQPAKQSYTSWTVIKLKARLQELGENTTGKKAVLVKRLEDCDATATQPKCSGSEPKKCSGSEEAAALAAELKEAASAALEELKEARILLKTLESEHTAVAKTLSDHQLAEVAAISLAKAQRNAVLLVEEQAASEANKASAAAQAAAKHAAAEHAEMQEFAATKAAAAAIANEEVASAARKAAAATAELLAAEEAVSIKQLQEKAAKHEVARWEATVAQATAEQAAIQKASSTVFEVAKKCDRYG